MPGSAGPSSPKRPPAATGSRLQDLRRLADALPQLVWIARPDGHIDYYNQSCLEYTGLTLDELVGWGWQRVLHPDELDIKMQRWSECLRSGDDFEIEYRLKRFDGCYRWHLGRALPFRDRQSRIVKWFGTSTDIEGQKRAEQALREDQQALQRSVADRTEELTRVSDALTEEIAGRRNVERRLLEQAEILQSVLSDMGDAVIVADADERFVMFNPAAERMFGQGAVAGPSDTWPQLYGLYLADRQTPFPADQMPLVRSIRGEEVNDVDVYVRHAAAPAGLWTRVSGRPLRDASGAISGGVIVCRDITELKRSEEAVGLLNTIIMEVAAAEDLTASLQVVLRRVCEKTGWAAGQAWVVSRDGTHLVCSDAWHAAIPGLEEFRADSRTTRFLPGAGLPGRVWASGQSAWIRDVTVDANFPRVRAAKAVGLKAALGFPIVARNRVVAVVEFFLQEPRHEDERLVMLIGTVAAQLDLVLERKQAEEALHDSYERIQDLAGRLIVAEEAERTRIARDLHDDINQRLAGLSIILSSLKRRIGQLDETMLGESLTALQERTIALVDNVRRLSHELHPGVLQHAGIAAALEGHCAEFSEQHGIEVDFDAGDLDPIKPDVALCLFRVAQEVMRNVAKHADAHRVRVTLLGAAGELTMTIADDGKGFDANGIGHTGSGLGLLSIEERVRLLKGSVTIESSAKRGTTLRISIPEATF